MPDVEAMLEIVRTVAAELGIGASAPQALTTESGEVLTTESGEEILVDAPPGEIRASLEINRTVSAELELTK